jgi:hypothetical protein
LNLVFGEESFDMRNAIVAAAARRGVALQTDS